ncbi:MAG TPA: exodeoxyribonuclease VII large subunit [Stellaceae bacterium]|nr:exodeoxyribonuclease VII large subunit [Stellaceae bacterium]
MTDSHLPPAESAGSNLPEYTVSEISQAVKRSLEQDFGHVRVRGEISGCKRHTSGHCYLTLKDADAALDGVIWRGTFQRVAVQPEDGMEVICTGRITTYPGRSKYQLVIESVELAGVGALLKLLEERKKKLAAEGLFDPAKKRPLPYLPEIIGVVTSPTGAVIRDILHRLADRFPRRVLVWPVAVQGESAAREVAAAIDGFNRLTPGGALPRPDLLIVARGGGSLEDLMAFNEEIVVRAAAASAIPLISAIGHETDTTLIDFASDRRAPTPSAAAEMAVPVRLELLANVGGFETRLANCLVRFLDERRTRARDLARGLPDPRTLLEGAQQRLDDRAERLKNGFDQFLRLHGQRLQALGERLRRDILDSELGRLRARAAELAARLKPALARLLHQQEVALAGTGGRLVNWQQAQQKVLERGYVRVRDAQGAVLIAAAQVAPGADLTLEFHDAAIGARATGGKPPPPPLGKPREPAPGNQGKLL